MSLNMKLQMRLSQQLIMTPQLQQAIKLLQLSRQELEELIDQALIENPVLEESPEEGEPIEEIQDRETELTPLEVAEGGDVISTPDHVENDLDWQQYIESGSGIIPERSSRDDGSEPNLEATLSQGETLQEHLMWQLEMSSLSPLEMLIGEVLIGNLDDDGYLTLSIQEILETSADLHKLIESALKENELTLEPAVLNDPAILEARHTPSQSVREGGKKKRREPPKFEEDQASQADIPAEDTIKVKPEVALQLEAVLRHIQQYDPLGVAARTLQECLENQLILMGMRDNLSFQIVHNDLKLLENKDLKKVARRRKADLEAVLESYKLIMSLEPKPGRPFTLDRAQSIIPDVYIYKAWGETGESEDRVGQYRVVLNDSGVPRLKISDFYRGMAEDKKKSSSLTQEYIQEKIKAGNWLMKSIEQRQKTILRVTKSILKHQYEFFEKGINYLKPLVLKDVAEDISVHESTVSRITTNKYVHTPQGIFELKYFFTSGIDQGHGEIISSKKIKDMILKIITGEDPRDPLTDIQIADYLSKESKIKVARRTVAKYREALNLLPSNKRKKLF